MSVRFRFRPPAGCRELRPSENIKAGDKVYYQGRWTTAKERRAIGKRVALRKDYPWVRQLTPSADAVKKGPTNE